jgi:hypothetical protein
MLTRRIYSLAVAVSVSLIIVSSARAQYKLELCEDLKITEAHHGINTVETAACINPTKTFSPKGTLRNVNVLYTFPKQPTGGGLTFMIKKENADGEYDADGEVRLARRMTVSTICVSKCEKEPSLIA